MRRAIFLVCAALVFLATLVGCGSEEPAASVPTTTDSAAETPSEVAATRSGILSAAESGDYDELERLVEPDVFLSDFGFGGPDPVQRWRELGPQPLETMAVLLRMPHTVRETNEGTLYQWPRFGADSQAEDVSSEERALLAEVMTDAELKAGILPELGYTGPRLGILADGTWWFFILEGGP
jgi:hypothetical protein